MVCPAGFAPGRTTIRPQLAHLRMPQATVLALGSFGMVRARSGARPAVRPLLAAGRQRHEHTVRQRLREGYSDTPRQRGSTRPALDVEPCCAPWWGWGGSGWQGTPRAWALDATTWGQRGVGLAVRVGSRGGALPGAWGSLPAGAQRAGLRRRRRRRPASPPGGPGLGLAERGGEAPGLLRRLPRWGWPPVWRRHTGGSWRPPDAPGWRPVARGAPPPGTRGRGTGLAWTRHRGPWTVLAHWAAGSQAPGLLRPALAPEASEAGG